MARWVRLQAGRDHASKNRRSRAGGSQPDERWSRRQGRYRLRAAAYAEGGKPVPPRQLVLACQGPHARGRTAVPEARPLHTLHGGRQPPVDEVTPAFLDQRSVVSATVSDERQLFAGFIVEGENNGQSQYTTI